MKSVLLIGQSNMAGGGVFFKNTPLANFYMKLHQFIMKTFTHLKTEDGR